MNKVEVIKANVNLIYGKKSAQIDKRLRVAAYCRVSTDNEEIVEQAFVNAFNLIKSNNKALLEGFISKVQESLNEHNVAKKLEKIEKELSTLESKELKLVDMHLEGIIYKSGL